MRSRTRSATCDGGSQNGCDIGMTGLLVIAVVIDVTTKQVAERNLTKRSGDLGAARQHTRIDRSGWAHTTVIALIVVPGRWR